MAKNSWDVPDGFNAAEKKALKAVFDALRNAQKQIPPEALEALRFGNLEGFISLVNWEEIELSLDQVKSILGAQAALSGQSFYTANSVQSTLLFNLIDEKAVAWAEKHAGELIRSISDSLRESIRATVAQSLNGELTVAQLGRRIRTNLPLLPRDAGAVDAFRQRNFEKFMQAGMSEAKAREKAEAKAERYAEKLTRNRSATIARTEIMGASNEGRYQGWQAGVESGYIDNASVKEWIAEPDACEICAPMDGTTVPWNDSFESGDEMPPAHPNCRCTAAILPPDYADSVFTNQAEEFMD
jgi:hypothetical protein